MDQPRTYISVDLGTTWTAACTDDGGRPVPVALGTHHPSMPSVVAFDGERFVVGEAAERLIRDRPDAGVREVKRRFGDTTPIVIDGTPFGADALMAEMLRHVARTAYPAGWSDVEVVLTHPANWGAYKLELLENVGEQAGFARVLLQPEPVAAALHFASTGRLQPGQTVAVYDFGGGTFDAAVVRLDETAGVLGQPQGLERMGGIDIDQMVFAHVLRSLDVTIADLDGANADVQAAVAALRADCTKAKEALSADSDVAIDVRLPGLTTTVRITRVELESMLAPRVEETLATLDRAIASAGLTSDEIDAVVLVGGSAQIPLVAERVRTHTNLAPLFGTDPKLVVAGGALKGVRVSPAEAAPVIAAGAAAGESASDPQAPGTGDGKAPAEAEARAGATAGRRTPAPPPARPERAGVSKAAKLAGGAAATAAAVAAGMVFREEVASAVGLDDDAKDADRMAPNDGGVAEGERLAAFDEPTVATSIAGDSGADVSAAGAFAAGAFAAGASAPDASATPTSVPADPMGAEANMGAESGSSGFVDSPEAGRAPSHSSGASAGYAEQGPAGFVDSMDAFDTPVPSARPAGGAPVQGVAAAEPGGAPGWRDTPAAPAPPMAPAARMQAPPAQPVGEQAAAAVRPAAVRPAPAPASEDLRSDAGPTATRVAPTSQADAATRGAPKSHADAPTSGADAAAPRAQATATTPASTGADPATEAAPVTAAAAAAASAPVAEAAPTSVGSDGETATVAPAVEAPVGEAAEDHADADDPVTDPGADLGADPGEARVTAADAPPAGDQGFDETRAELLARVAGFEPPGGSSAESVEAFRAELTGMIERFEPGSRLTPDQAVAALRDEFDERLQDYLQDQKIDALINQQLRSLADEAATAATPRETTTSDPIGPTAAIETDADDAASEPVSEQMAEDDPATSSPLSAENTGIAGNRDEIQAALEAEEQQGEDTEAGPSTIPVEDAGTEVSPPAGDDNAPVGDDAAQAGDGTATVGDDSAAGGDEAESGSTSDPGDVADVGIASGETPATGMSAEPEFDALGASIADPAPPMTGEFGDASTASSVGDALVDIPVLVDVFDDGASDPPTSLSEPAAPSFAPIAQPRVAAPRSVASPAARAPSVPETEPLGFDRAAHLASRSGSAGQAEPSAADLEGLARMGAAGRQAEGSAARDDVAQRMGAAGRQAEGSAVGDEAGSRMAAGRQAEGSAARDDVAQRMGAAGRQAEGSPVGDEAGSRMAAGRQAEPDSARDERAERMDAAGRQAEQQIARDDGAERMAGRQAEGSPVADEGQASMTTMAGLTQPIGSRTGGGAGVGARSVATGSEQGAPASPSLDPITGEQIVASGPGAPATVGAASAADAEPVSAPVADPAQAPIESPLDPVTGEVAATGAEPAPALVVAAAPPAQEPTPDPGLDDPADALEPIAFDLTQGSGTGDPSGPFVVVEPEPLAMSVDDYLSPVAEAGFADDLASEIAPDAPTNLDFGT